MANGERKTKPKGFQPGQSGNDATKFQQGKSGNPSGRPKKILTIVKEQGYGKTDAITAFQELMWSSADDLRKLCMDKKTPIILRAVAESLRKAMLNGEVHRIRELLDYTIGRPVQKIDQTNTNFNHSVELTKSTIKKINKALEDEY